MKSTSTEFQDIFNESDPLLDGAVYMHHKILCEFGSNRFNDGQVCTASSTKLVNRGFGPFNPTTTFWAPEEAFNNKNKNTMKWLVCDQGATVKATADGTGHRAVNLQDKDAEYERGWWSANKSNGSGIFTSPEWVMSEWWSDDAHTVPFQRRVNKVSLFLTEGYPNMLKVTVQYKDVNDVWIDLEVDRTLDVDEYQVDWTIGGDPVYMEGLRVYVKETREAGSFARLQELNAFYIEDISGDVITLDTKETRENYEDSSVPIGTIAANTADIELDNTQGLYNTNNPDSIYAQYLGANNRVEVYLGVDKNRGQGSPDIEYVQMGEFWSDDWDTSGDNLTTRLTCRDFSKFLQDDNFTFGRSWEDTNVAEVFRNILLRKNFPIERISIDENELRGYTSIFIKDRSPWDFLAELAFADQGVFGFDYLGNFYYHSFTRLNDAPYDTVVQDYRWDRNIVSGDIKTILYINKVTVKVTPSSLNETGVKHIWGPQSPQILSFAKLGASINTTDTTITVDLAGQQTTANLTENGWPTINGIIFIPKFQINGVDVGHDVVFTQANAAKEVAGLECVGGELIKYADRSDSQFTNCERGYLGTVAASYGGGQLLGEGRYYEADFDNSPATAVKFPFMTCVDTLKTFPGEGRPEAYVVIYQYDAFTAKLAIGNIIPHLTILEGQGPTWRDELDTTSDSSVNFNTAIAGVVTVQKAGNETAAGKVDDPSQTNADFVRRYGKNEIQIDNPWIQSKQHAQDIADAIITAYKEGRELVNLSIFGNPALQTGDLVVIQNYPQLDIQDKAYNVVSIDYAYDGGLQTSVILRENREAMI